MSRPDLYDLMAAQGGMSLIPEYLCAEARIGQAKVWAVLVHRSLNADANGLSYMGTPRIAAETGLQRRSVQEADAVLEEAQLIVRTGRRRSRAVEFHVIPVLLAEHYANADVTGEVTGEVTGNVTGNVTGMPGPIGREGTREPSGSLVPSPNAVDAEADDDSEVDVDHRAGRNAAVKAAIDAEFLDRDLTDPRYAAMYRARLHHAGVEAVTS